MESKFQVSYSVEGMDVDLSENESWTLEGDIATCALNANTLSDLLEALNAVGDSFDSYELEEIEALTIGEEAEIDRGRGSWYSIKRIA